MSTHKLAYRLTQIFAIDIVKTTIIQHPAWSSLSKTPTLTPAQNSSNTKIVSNHDANNMANTATKINRHLLPHLALVNDRGIATMSRW
jgi:hypothetical protein